MKERTSKGEKTSGEKTITPRVGIFGAGAWGTAVAKVLSDKGLRVEIWSFEQEVAQEINKKHTNNRYLYGVNLPQTLKASNIPQEVATDKDYILFVIPSLFLLNIVKSILGVKNIMEGKSYIGILTKGFIETEGEIHLITEVIENYLPGFYKDKLVYISGPSHAEEVARGKLTGLISASKNGKNAIRFRNLLSSDSLMVFPSLDITGVQVSAALKNVIAIAFGMLDALKELLDIFGDNTESLLLAAGLNEIQQVGLAMGSTHPETFTSIAGVGDLDVTCRSKYGRNRRFGREIVLDNVLSKFRNIEDLLANLPSLGYIPEGAAATRCAHILNKQYKLKLPIISGVYKILNREEEPADELRNILFKLTSPSKRQIF